MQDGVPQLAILLAAGGAALLTASFGLESLVILLAVFVGPFEVKVRGFAAVQEVHEMQLAGKSILGFPDLGFFAAALVERVENVQQDRRVLGAALDIGLYHHAGEFDSTVRRGSKLQAILGEVGRALVLDCFECASHD